MEGEIWKPVLGWESTYEVSNKGRVRSLDRSVFNKGNGAYCNRKGVILKYNVDNGGYKYVTLFIEARHRKRDSLKIHRLVAFAFCEGYKDGLEVNHIDGNKTNNDSSNLEWVTRSQNIRHKYVLGYHQRGERGTNAKLTNKDIPIIMSLYESGVRQSVIAKAFAVSQGTISNAISGKCFSTDCLIESGLAEPIPSIPQ
jgi:hypothetical protein